MLVGSRGKELGAAGSVRKYLTQKIFHAKRQEKMGNWE
jgi:hypothetical protein